MLFELGFARKGADLSRHEKPRRRAASKFHPALESVESRCVPTGGVTMSGGVIWIAPDTAQAANSARVSMQAQNQVIDVNLNGTEYAFDASTVYYLIFDASQTSAGTTQVFRNDTSMSSFAMGGAGTNQFTAGSGYDTFLGGSGRNQFASTSGMVFFIGGYSGTNEFDLGSGSGIVMMFGSNNRVTQGSNGNYAVYRYPSSSRGTGIPCHDSVEPVIDFSRDVRRLYVMSTPARRRIPATSPMPNGNSSSPTWS
ncbi:MAG: hypothetical protein U0800_11685 [Isosphaeraceae bacterium]